MFLSLRILLPLLRRFAVFSYRQSLRGLLLIPCHNKMWPPPRDVTPSLPQTPLTIPVPATGRVQIQCKKESSLKLSHPHAWIKQAAAACRRRRARHDNRRSGGTELAWAADKLVCYLMIIVERASEADAQVRR